MRTELEQIIIPMAGSFDVRLDHGKSQANYRLCRPSQGLYVCPLIRRELTEFSHNAVCVVLASLGYDEDDYLKSYKEFKDYTLVVS